MLAKPTYWPSWAAEALTASDRGKLQHTVRHRVLRYFHRHGLLERHVTDDMLTWQASGGFSIDASVHIPGGDRARLERLLHGVLAPNAKLRYQVIALGHEQGRVEESPSGQLGTQSVAGSSGGAPGRRMSSRWASLIARIYDVLPLVCPSCGASMSIIAFITD